MARLIDHVEESGLSALLPDVVPVTKDNKPTFEEKLKWTLYVLLVYLVASQLPLYGIDKSSRSDPFYILRMILASRGGTIMELGITPIITSGMVMQLLAGAQLIDYDQSKEDDRRKFHATSKVLGIVICLGEAVVYTVTGSYGPLSELGLITSFLLMAQLFVGGMITLILQEVLEKGWGIGQGINLFIVTNICQSILWQCFSPTLVSTGSGSEFEGCIVNLFHSLLTRSNKMSALSNAFFRDNQPNIMNLLATITIFLVVIYVQGLKVLVPLKMKETNRVPRGAVPNIPPYGIKLLYTSNMPIILVGALVGNLFFFNQILYRRYPGNLLVRLLGQWDSEGRYGGRRPSGGLSYYLSAPESFTEIVADPFHFVFYLTFMCTVCALFAKVWVEVSGTGASSVMHNLAAQGVEPATGTAKRNKVTQFVPIAAAVGGVGVALLSVFADLLGAIGSGTGILMAVTIIFDIFENAAESYQKENMAKSGRGAGASLWDQLLTSSKGKGKTLNNE